VIGKALKSKELKKSTKECKLERVSEILEEKLEEWYTDITPMFI